MPFRPLLVPPPLHDLLPRHEFLERTRYVPTEQLETASLERVQFHAPPRERRHHFYPRHGVVELLPLALELLRYLDGGSVEFHRRRFRVRDHGRQVDFLVGTGGRFADVVDVFRLDLILLREDHPLGEFHPQAADVVGKLSPDNGSAVLLQRFFQLLALGITIVYGYLYLEIQDCLSVFLINILQ